jgi:hypothetical protein
MFTKTFAAVLTAAVLALSFVSAQAQTNPNRGCVSMNSTEEGALSAIPAWRLC